MLSDDDIMLAVGKEADGLLDHIHEYGTIAEGVRQRIVALCRRAIEAAALAAQPAKPVAWMDDFGNAFPLGAIKGAGSWRDEHQRNWRPLYTAPPAPAAVPLPEPFDYCYEWHGPYGLEVVDNLDGTMGLRAALAQKAEPQGEVVVTKDDAGQIVAVTRQDAEGRILSVVAESAPAAAIRAGS